MPEHANDYSPVTGFTLTADAADAWAEVFEHMAASSASQRQPDLVADAPIEIKSAKPRKKRSTQEPTE